MRFPSLLCTIGAILCATAAFPASAMQLQRAQNGEEVFVNLGRWVIVQDESARACELRLNSDPQVVLRYRLSDGRGGMMALQRKSGRFFSGMVGGVEWAFDDARFAGYQSNNGYSLPAGGRNVESGFRSAKFLRVTHGGQQVARIDLKTSSAGFRLLKQCAEQWRYVPWFRRLESARYREAEARNSRAVAPAPEPATAPQPPQTAGRTIGLPLPPPKPRPVNPAAWIGSGDSLPWPSRGFRSGQGVLNYTLLVNEDGRAEECEVNRSTGSRRFDRQACRLLVDRARFEPARSSNGQVVESRYSSTMRFAGE